VNQTKINEMIEKDINYDRDIQIDDAALDLEWCGQAELAMKYGKHWVKCKNVLSEAEEKVKVVRAELINRVNSNPMKFCNKEKPNAADIESYYRRHLRHKEAKQELLEAQFELSMAEIAKNEISFTRKVALENLVKLHGQEYFAGPKMPRNLTEERKAKEDRIKARVAQTLKPKRKRERN